MITNDYIQGLQKALKLVEENLEHRRKNIKDFCFTMHMMQENEHNIRISEIDMIKSHLVQVRESYRKLVEDLNRGIKQ